MVEGLCDVSCKKQGHPRKCREGWVSVNKWIYISDKTFNKRIGLRAERDLSSDDAVACYLLTFHNQPELLCLQNQLFSSVAW